jgi:hypothetical protein
MIASAVQWADRIMTRGEDALGDDLAVVVGPSRITDLSGLRLSFSIRRMADSPVTPSGANSSELSHRKRPKSIRKRKAVRCAAHDCPSRYP